MNYLHLIPGVQNKSNFERTSLALSFSDAGLSEEDLDIFFLTSFRETFDRLSSPYLDFQAVPWKEDTSSRLVPQRYLTAFVPPRRKRNLFLVFVDCNREGKVVASCSICCGTRIVFLCFASGGLSRHIRLETWEERHGTYVEVHPGLATMGRASILRDSKNRRRSTLGAEHRGFLLLCEA